MTAGNIILANQLESLEEFPDAPETYVIGDMRVVPNVVRKFESDDQLGIYLQVYNPSLDSSEFTPAVSVEYTITKGPEIMGQSIDETGATLAFHSARRLVLAKNIVLRGVEAGRYQLTVKVDDQISGRALTSQEEFEVESR
jgi:hypothetical protein